MDDIFHMARHTSGTMSLSAGIPIESIAKMIGHASIASTQIYAQVTDNKISEDMDRLIRRLQKEETREEAIWTSITIKQKETAAIFFFIAQGQSQQLVRDIVKYAFEQILSKIK